MGCHGRAVPQGPTAGPQQNKNPADRWLYRNRGRLFPQLHNADYQAHFDEFIRHHIRRVLPISPGSFLLAYRCAKDSARDQILRHRRHESPFHLPVCADGRRGMVPAYRPTFLPWLIRLGGRKAGTTSHKPRRLSAFMVPLLLALQEKNIHPGLIALAWRTSDLLRIQSINPRSTSPIPKKTEPPNLWWKSPSMNLMSIW